MFHNLSIYHVHLTYTLLRERKTIQSFFTSFKYCGFRNIVDFDKRWILENSFTITAENFLVIGTWKFWWNRMPDIWLTSHGVCTELRALTFDQHTNSFVCLLFIRWFSKPEFIWLIYTVLCFSSKCMPGVNEFKDVIIKI